MKFKNAFTGVFCWSWCKCRRFSEWTNQSMTGLLWYSKTLMQRSLDNIINCY